MIHNEREFIEAVRERARLDEAVLRRERKRDIFGLDDFLLAECELNTLGADRDRLQQEMDRYDREHNGDRVGTWMPIGPGTRFWAEDPRPHDYDIRDIAHGLAHINRFNGRIKYDHYSVAQHSVLVCALLPDRLKLFGLMHDAGEAYLCDIITPVKRLFCAFYEGVEDRVMRSVATRYGFLAEYDDGKDLVKRADTVMLATEARDVTALGFVSQRLTELPMEKRIEVPWGPEAAERAFLRTFHELTNGAGAIAA